MEPVVLTSVSQTEFAELLVELLKAEGIRKRTTNPIYQSLGPLVMMRRPGGDHDQSETTGQSSGSQGRAGAALA